MLKPLKFKPLKLTKRTLFPRNDADFDSIPDSKDCNPHNPFQQDNNSLSTTSLIPIKRKQQYIPPQQPSQQQPIDAEYTNIQPPDEPLPSSKYDQQYEQAKQAYSQTTTQPSILFLQTTSGQWTRTPYKFMGDELSFQDESKIQQILQNPDYINYQLSQDPYFAEKKNSRQQRLSSYSQNVRDTFKQQPLSQHQIDYSRGPSDLPTTPPLKQPKQQYPDQILNSYSQNFTRPRYPDEPPSTLSQLSLDEKPLGFSDSPFPMHVGYYPIKPKPVKGDKKRPLFRPPLVRF